MRLGDKPVAELDLTVRSYNCLKKANIRTLGDLVHKTELELLKKKTLGRKSLNEIKKLLDGLGLRLGMPDDGEEDIAVPAVRPNMPLQPSSARRLPFKER